MTTPPTPTVSAVEGLRADLERIRELAKAATPGPWRSMRDGNQYLETKYVPTAKCVGASRVDGLPRPWNPHAYVAFGFKPEEFETTRLLDADADYLDAVQPAAMLRILDALDSLLPSPPTRGAGT